MFNRRRPDVGRTDTLIGEGSAFTGKIQSKASIRVEGLLSGDIICEGDVTIGERGTARSDITARNIIVAGTVHGDVLARHTLTITSTGKLFGNASAKTLVIAEGAIFQGMSRMAIKEEADESDSTGSSGTSGTNGTSDSSGSRGLSGSSAPAGTPSSAMYG